MLALLAMLLIALPCFAMPPPDRVAVLQRGVNMTGWFRYPASREPAVLRRWLSDAAMADLKRVGFTFVRLAVDPAVVDDQPMRRLLVDQVKRLQRHGLAVIVSPHPVGWDLDKNLSDRDRLIAFWRDLASMLRGLSPRLTFPEVLNEPVFRDDATAWWSLQIDLHAAIRAALPDNTIILTGQDWGSIAGLLALTPTRGPKRRRQRGLQLPFLRAGGADLARRLSSRPGPRRAGAIAVSRNRPGRLPAVARGREMRRRVT